MAQFLQLASGIDVAPLRAALESQPGLFGQLTHRAEYVNSPHTAMSDIWVRYNAYENLGPAFNDEHDSVWYPSADHLPEIKPIVFALMHKVQGERLGGILITKIPPGGGIAPHIDVGWHAGYYDKFFIPIKSAPGALFRFPDGDINAQPGDCYWFDNSVDHSVENNSAEDRIAMIVCIKTSLFNGYKHD